jgi:hypothetical protein
MINSDRLEFFIKDNASENNIIIRVITTYLYFNEKNSNSKSIICLGYIINLAIRPFLFK